MTTHGSINRATVISTLVLRLCAAAGCAAGGDSAAWRGTIDTLPNGAVHVRNDGGQLWDSSTAWRLVEDLRIGTAGEGPQSFSTVAGLEVDAAGRIYVIDRQAQEIRVFDSTGAFVRRIGRPGQGPGELVGANGLAWDPRGRLWVVDQQGERYSLFDTTGKLVEDRRRNLLFYGWLWEGMVDTAGRLLEAKTLRGTGESRRVMVRFDWARSRTDTFDFPVRQGESPFFRFDRGGGYMVMSVPFTPGLHWRVDRQGDLWFGASDAYRIYKRRLLGDTLRIVERAVAAVPVTTAEEDSVVADIVRRVGAGTQVDRSRIPEVKPAFQTFWLDDAGHLWVLRSQPRGDERQELDVVDGVGRYLGSVTVPFRVGVYSPLAFRRNHLYAVTEDADGVPYVVRARIESPGS